MRAPNSPMSPCSCTSSRVPSDKVTITARTSAATRAMNVLGPKSETPLEVVMCRPGDTGGPPQPPPQGRDPSGSSIATPVNNSPVSRLTAASRCQMSPSVEYPLAITDMDAVCQAKHGPSRSYLPSVVLATEHPTLLDICG